MPVTSLGSMQQRNRYRPSGFENAHNQIFVNPRLTAVRFLRSL
jgi:hypothetical protein